MTSFHNHTAALLQEEADYYQALELIGSHELNENFLANLSSSIRSKIDFIKGLAEASGQALESLLVLFKNSKVYKFFSALRFNLATLWKYVKAGYSAYGQLQRAIAEYVSKTRVARWTAEALKGLDDWLQRHPKLKRIGGFAVAGLLVYIWMNMSFTGDANYDFDFSDILAAVSGNYSLSALFSGTEGTRLLLLFATGLLGLGFPWPGPTSAKFALALVNGLRKLVTNS